MLRNVVTAASMERYESQFGRRGLLKVAVAVCFSWVNSRWRFVLPV